jgi:hypothetical protein
MKYHLFAAILLLLAGCAQPGNTKQAAGKPDSLQKDTATPPDQLEETLSDIPKNIKPVFGYRFIIEGDFDGDGSTEKLAEHYFSRLDNQETNKFYDGLTDYDQLVALTIRKKPRSFALCDNHFIDTLDIASDGQLLGLSYLKNEGDLNGDGTDEVSYVVNWADWSNLNTWHIVTYKNHKWKELYSFPIRDWQLPDLPQTLNQYGPAGLENKIVDTTGNADEKKLKDFKGLVRKIRPNQIRVVYRNDEAEEDSMTVDLP